jgi:xylulokinase
MCSEVLDGQVVAPPDARRVRPRGDWRETVARRWQEYREVWSTVTGVQPLSTLDEALTRNVCS